MVGQGSMWNSDVVDEESEESSSDDIGEEEDDRRRREHNRLPPLVAVVQQKNEAERGKSDRRNVVAPTVGLAAAADDEIEDMLEVWKRKRTLKSER
jgi:hypothetical protein